MSGPPQPTAGLFYVYAPDRAESGIVEKRIGAKDEHGKRAREFIANGTLRSAGIIFSETAPHRMVGNSLLIHAESLEKAKEIVKTDAFYTAGVWDPEKIVVAPYFAVPIPPPQGK